LEELRQFRLNVPEALPGSEAEETGSHDPD
jgi:hypothetical protein